MSPGPRPSARGPLPGTMKSEGSKPLVPLLPWVSTVLALSMAACGGQTENGATGAPSSGGASSGGGVTGARSGGDAGAAGAGSGGAAPGCAPTVELGEAPGAMTPVAVALGDFNLDGKPDLAVANQDSNSVSVLLGNGDGTFADRVDYARGDGLGPVAVGDFNLDGKPDLALAKSTFGMSGTVSVLLGNGDGTFGARVDCEVQHEWTSSLTSLAVSDFDLDGKPDIAVTDAFFNTLTVLLGRCM